MKRVTRIKASVVQVWTSLAWSQTWFFMGQSLKVVSAREHILKLSDCLDSQRGARDGKDKEQILLPTDIYMWVSVSPPHCPTPLSFLPFLSFLLPYEENQRQRIHKPNHCGLRDDLDKGTQEWPTQEFQRANQQNTHHEVLHPLFPREVPQWPIFPCQISHHHRHGSGRPTDHRGPSPKKAR